MKKNFRHILCWLFFLSIVGGCSAVHNLKPLDRGDSQVYASLGGPLITEGVSFPVPYTIAGYAYGVHEKLTLHGELHPSAAIYKTFAAGIGGLIGFVKEAGWIPELAVDLQGVFASDFSETVLFPIATPILSYQLWNPAWHGYAGIDILWQLHSHDDAAAPRSYAPLIGIRYTPQAQKLGFGIETKWLGVSDEIQESTLDFPKPFGSNYGDLGVYLHFHYPFPTGEKS